MGCNLDILFVTDYVCPYCLVEKEALHQALQETGIQANIRVQPFELTEEPKPRVDTYHDAKRKEHYQVLEKPAEELGLAMKLPPAVVPRPYSRLAFEGLHFAQEHGRGEEYSDLVYRAYFIDEKDIGDLETLQELAEKAGLDGEAFRAALVSGTYREAEKSAVAYAKQVLQVDCIPTIYIDGRKIELETYTTAEMIRILQEQTAST